jgi:hypothetical protein
LTGIWRPEPGNIICFFKSRAGQDLRGFFVFRPLALLQDAPFSG